MDESNPIYEKYKEQSKSRQKYWLALVAFIVGFGLGRLVGLF